LPIETSLKSASFIIFGGSKRNYKPEVNFNSQFVLSKLDISMEGEGTAILSYFGRKSFV